MGSYPSVVKVGEFFELSAQASIGDMDDKDQEFRQVEEFEREAEVVLEGVFGLIERALGEFSGVLCAFESEEGTLEYVVIPLPQSRQTGWVQELSVRVRVKDAAVMAGLRDALERVFVE